MLLRAFAPNLEVLEGKFVLCHPAAEAEAPEQVRISIFFLALFPIRIVQCYTERLAWYLTKYNLATCVFKLTKLVAFQPNYYKKVNVITYFVDFFPVYFFAKNLSISLSKTILDEKNPFPTARPLRFPPLR